MLTLKLKIAQNPYMVWNFKILDVYVLRALP